MGPMSAHNAERSSKRSSGGPHVGFRGVKVTPLFTFPVREYIAAATTLHRLLVSGSHYCSILLTRGGHA